MERARPISRSDITASSSSSSLRRHVLPLPRQVLHLPIDCSPLIKGAQPLIPYQSSPTRGEQLNIRSFDNHRQKLIHQPANIKFNIQEEIQHVPSIPIDFLPPHPSLTLSESLPSRLLTPMIEMVVPDVLRPSFLLPSQGPQGHSEGPQGQGQSLSYEDSTTLSVNTARSFNTENTESNSLFKSHDDGSIDRYMKDILIRQQQQLQQVHHNYHDPLTQDNNNNNNNNNTDINNNDSRPNHDEQGESHHVHGHGHGHRPMTLYIDAEAAIHHYTIRCNNISSWTISSSSVKVHMINFKIIEDIFYREALLIKMKAHLESIDHTYWQYAIDRIKLIESGKSLQGELLISRRNEIMLMQNKLAVEIAHLRSLTISILENIQKIRLLIQEEISIENLKENSGAAAATATATAIAAVSIYWKEENYLLKMMDDFSSFMMNYSSLRYWYGFQPNPLLIPPLEHNPYQTWKLQTGLLFSTWITMHKEKLIKDKKASRQHHRRGYIIQDTKFLFDNLQLLQEVEKNDQIAKKHQFPTSTTTPREEEEDNQSTPSSPSTTTTTNTPNHPHRTSETEEDIERGKKETETKTETKTETESEKVVSRRGTSSNSPLPHSSRLLSSSHSSRGGGGGEYQQQHHSSLRNSHSRQGGSNSRHRSRGGDESRDALTSRGETSRHHQHHHHHGIISRFGSDDSGKGMMTSRSHPLVRVFEPWEQLRDYCDYSWGEIEDLTDEQLDRYQLRNTSLPNYTLKKAIIQSVDIAQFFWNNPNHNPYVVEAAIGFAEIFPSIFIIPPLPLDLRRRCLDLMVLFEDEVRINQSLKEKREKVEQKRMIYESLQSNSSSSIINLHNNSLENVIGGGGLDITSSMQENSQEEDNNDSNGCCFQTKELLKLRHQSDSTLLTGISSKYIQNQASMITIPLNASNSYIGLPPLESSVMLDQSHSMLFEGEKVFSLTLDESQYNHNTNNKMEYVSKTLDPSTSTASLSLIQDLSSAFPIPSIETSLTTTRNRIVNKVRGSRHLITNRFLRTDDTGTNQPEWMTTADTISTRSAHSERFFDDDGASTPPPLIRTSSFAKRENGMAQVAFRNDRKGRREIYRLDPKFVNIHAVHIQRLIRGYLARRRVAVIRRKRNWKRTLAKVQGVVRGFMGRLQKIRAEREVKVETFMLRKDALKRFRAAITISRFIRMVVNQYRLKRQEPLLVDKLDDNGRPLNKRESMRRLRSSLDPETIDLLKSDALPRPMVLARDDDGVNVTVDLSPSSHSRRKTTTRRPALTLNQPIVSRSDSFPLEDVVALKSSLGRRFTNNTIGSTPFASRPSSPTEISLASSSTTNGGSSEASSVDEFQRRLQLQEEAIALVKKVNAGKDRPDSRRVCRLIPFEAGSPAKKVLPRPKFSSKERFFLQKQDQQGSTPDPMSSSSSNKPQSMIKSTYDAYKPPPFASLLHKKQARSSSEDANDTEITAQVHKSIEEIKKDKMQREAARFKGTLREIFR